MNIVVAVDSFKGSLSSLEAGETLKEAIESLKQDQVQVFPLADGGEGTMQTLVDGLKGIYHTVQVCGPIKQKVEAQYGMVHDTVIIEIAEAAGLTLVPEKQRCPLDTTTYGVGEMIIDALNRGYRHFLIGLGGSATNDGGIGMLSALGYQFFDDQGHPCIYGARDLKRIKSISNEHVHPALKEATFEIACDVQNPLCGQEGCSFVFGPQKGADVDMIRDMDEALLHFSECVKKKFNLDYQNIPGVGTAGGLGYAFLTFLKATLRPGIDIVLEALQIEEAIRTADLVMTGEGCIDGQTAMGKGPSGVSQLAKKYDKKVIALAGCIGPNATRCHEIGIDAYFPILRRPMTLEEALDKQVAKMQLKETVIEICRLIHLVCGC